MMIQEEASNNDKSLLATTQQQQQQPQQTHQNVLLMATVVTGLEQVAREELITKCPSAEIFKLPNVGNQQGRIFFKIESNQDLSFLEQMWSLEKLYIVAQFKQIANVSLQKQPENAVSDEEKQRDMTLIQQELISPDQKESYDRALNLCDRFMKKERTNKTFRVTARRGGIHRFGSMELAAQFADGIVELYPDWKADLSNYEVEVFVYMHFDLCIVAFTAVDESLSLQRFETGDRKKNSSKQLTALSLRPSIAYGMIHLAKIQPGDTIVDVCCGSGMISAVTHESNVVPNNNFSFIAGDYALPVLEKAQFNNQAGSRSDFMYWSFTNLPLRDNSVDVIISNLPFGKKVGSRELNKKIYPPMMRELSRVLKSGSGRAVLLSTEKGLMHNGVKQNQSLIKLESRVTINMGGMEVFLYVIMKKSDKVQKKHRGRSTRKRRKKTHPTSPTTATTDTTVTSTATVAFIPETIPTSTTVEL